jgi:hypothetical protein
MMTNNQQQTSNNLSKSVNFKRGAERRTQRILDSLRLLSQCSNRRIYEYDDEQIAKIFKEIKIAVRRAEGSFAHTNKRGDFRL